MKDISRKGVEVTIIASDSNALSSMPRLSRTYEFRKDGELGVCWIRTLKYGTAKSLKRILSWLDFELKLFLFPFSRLPEPSTIIVSSLSLLTIINGLLLKRRYGAKLVFEVRDIWPLTIVEEGGFSDNDLFVRMLGRIERAGYANSDLIVGTMPNLEEHVRAIIPNPPPVACVPMGFDPSAFRSQKPLDPAVKGLIPKGKFIVGYAGTIGLTNALGTLMECARNMERLSNIHFVFAGDGDLLAGYRKDYGCLGNVTFTGRIPKDQVNALLQEFDVLYLAVLKSEVWRYGQSLNKLIDYMLAGKPVIASYTGFPSMIDEAGCGSFVPSEDRYALEEAILRYSSKQKSELLEIGSRGYEWIIEHRPDSRLADLYLELISGRIKLRELSGSMSPSR